MKYIIYYKVLYVVLLALNLFLLVVESPFNMDSYSVGIVLQDICLVSLNLYQLRQITNNKLKAQNLYLEYGISLYRLGGVFLAATCAPQMALRV